MVRLSVGLLLAGITLALAGCYEGGTPVLTHPTYPAPTAPASPVRPASILTGNALDGARVWHQKQCDACHGPNALGGMGGALAHTAQPFDEYLSSLRNAALPMPPFAPSDISDEDAHSIYLWLRSLSPVPATAAIVTPAPLPTGQILGIQVWTEKGCNQCHGAFGQGSATAPLLAGGSYPFERERTVMRNSADQIPAHSVTNLPDDLLQRLLDWLRRGANPSSGC